MAFYPNFFEKKFEKMTQNRPKKNPKIGHFSILKGIWKGHTASGLSLRRKSGGGQARLNLKQRFNAFARTLKNGK